MVCHEVPLRYDFPHWLVFWPFFPPKSVVLVKWELGIILIVNQPKRKRGFRLLGFLVVSNFFLYPLFSIIFIIGLYWSCQRYCHLLISLVLICPSTDICLIWRRGSKNQFFIPSPWLSASLMCPVIEIFDIMAVTQQRFPYHFQPGP